MIEIRPFRGGWQCFEAPGVQPYWTGESAKEDAIGYAKARAKFGRGEIHVLNVDGSIQELISFNEGSKKRSPLVVCLLAHDLLCTLAGRAPRGTVTLRPSPRKKLGAPLRLAIRLLSMTTKVPKTKVASATRLLCPPRRHLSADFGASEAASFWKRESFRSGSNIGSSRSGTRVSGGICPKSFRSIVSARGRRRFSRSADRRGAGPRRGAVLRRHSSVCTMRWEHAVQLPVAARQALCRPSTLL